MKILIKIFLIIGFLILSNSVYADGDWKTYSQANKQEKNEIISYGLHPPSYRSLGNYAIDINGVYYDYLKISSDIRNFETIYDSISRDTKNIFIKDKVLEGIDASKFIHYPDSTYGEYEEKILYINPVELGYFFIEGANTDSFQSFGSYAKDENYVYFEGEVLPGADAESFETEGHYGKDKNNIYSGMRILMKNNIFLNNQKDIKKYYKYKRPIRGAKRGAATFGIYFLHALTIAYVICYSLIYLIIVKQKEEKGRFFLNALKTQFIFNYLILIIYYFILIPLLIWSGIYSIINGVVGIVIISTLYAVFMSFLTLYRYGLHEKYTKVFLLKKGATVGVISWLIFAGGGYGLLFMLIRNIPTI